MYPSPELDCCVFPIRCVTLARRSAGCPRARRRAMLRDDEGPPERRSVACPMEGARRVPVGGRVVGNAPCTGCTCVDDTLQRANRMTPGAIQTADAKPEPLKVLIADD